jgi:hypothetical protein
VTGIGGQLGVSSRVQPGDRRTSRNLISSDAWLVCK